jgi:hypothetical protein
MKVLFLPKHFRRHLVYSRHFDFSGLATNFFTMRQIKHITYPKTKTFHLAVPLPKNHEFLSWCIKSAIFNFSAISAILNLKSLRIRLYIFINYLGERNRFLLHMSMD